MEPEKPPAQGDPRKDAPIPLDYVPLPQRRGLGSWISSRLARLNRPTSLGTNYLIMFVLSVIATMIALIIRAIILAFQ